MNHPERSQRRSGLPSRQKKRPRRLENRQKAFCERRIWRPRLLRPSHSRCRWLIPALASSTAIARTKQRFMVTPFHGFGTSLRLWMDRIRSYGTAGGHRHSGYGQTSTLGVRREARFPYSCDSGQIRARRISEKLRAGASYASWERREKVREV